MQLKFKGTHFFIIERTKTKAKRSSLLPVGMKIFVADVEKINFAPEQARNTVSKVVAFFKQFS